PRARDLHVLSRELGARGLAAASRMMHARAVEFASATLIFLLAVTRRSPYCAAPWGGVGRGGWKWSIEGRGGDQLLRHADLLDRPQGPHQCSRIHAPRRRPPSPDSSVHPGRRVRGLSRALWAE